MWLHTWWFAVTHFPRHVLRTSCYLLMCHKFGRYLRSQMLSILLLEVLIKVVAGHINTIILILISVFFDWILYHIFPYLFLEVLFELFELQWIRGLMLWNIISYGSLQFTVFIFLKIVKQLYSIDGLLNCSWWNIAIKLGERFYSVLFPHILFCITWWVIFSF